MVQLIGEDEHIAVVLKPAGMLSEGEGRGSVITALREMCGTEIYPIHRLDKETAGVMVYAKNKKAAAKLSEQVRENKIHKKYYAVLTAVPELKEATLEDLLFRDKQKNKTYVVKRMRKGVRDASLSYRVIGTNESFALADITLKTGRTHQIRVQFASRKMPLYGDGKYGGGSGKLALFSYSLSFTHPVTGEQMCFTAKPDIAEYPWNLFEEKI